MTKRLYILGAGGHGKVVADAAIKMNKWKEIFFLDDNLKGLTIQGILVKGSISEAIKYKSENSDFIVGIGNNSIRRQFLNHLKKLECNITTIIHPFTSIGSEVNIGKGTVIFGGVVINISAKIGEGCILNTACSIDHDSKISDFVHLSPGVKVAGNVLIGRECWIGIGAIVINNVKIASNIIVGAGGVVIHDLTKPGTYIGVPARFQKDNGGLFISKEFKDAIPKET